MIKYPLFGYSWVYPVDFPYFSYEMTPVTYYPQFMRPTSRHSSTVQVYSVKMFICKVIKDITSSDPMHTDHTQHLNPTAWNYH